MKHDVDYYWVGAIDLTVTHTAPINTPDQVTSHSNQCVKNSVSQVLYREENVEIGRALLVVRLASATILGILSCV